jgi:hypothetical protein
MRTAAGFALVLVFAGCAAPRPRPEPATLEARAELPPHVVEVAYGLYSCERGYLIRQGRCIPFEELEHGPVVEISSLPSAGDGAPGMCPSGGCDSFAVPSYSTFVYSGAGLRYGYDWPLYFGGRSVRRAHRFCGGELAFAGFGSFGREQRFASGGFLMAPLRFHSFPERRSRGGFAGARFGSNREGRGRWR